MSRKPYNLDRTVRLVINCVLAAGAIWLLSILSGVLLPFLVGCLIAYMFEPFVQFNRSLLKLRGRAVATFVTLFEMVLLFGLACYFVAPVVANECSQLADMLKKYADGSDTAIPFVPDSVHEFLKKNVDFEHLAAKLSRDQWVNMAEEGASAVWSLISTSVTFLLDLFSWAIVVLYVVFIMLDYDRISRGFRRAVPPKYRRVVFGIGHDVKVAMNQYFRGQALVAFIVGILFSIGFSIVGLPMAIILGLFIGVLNMVPYLQLVSFIPTTVLCLIYSAGTGIPFWTLFWECVAVYCIVQMLQDLVLTPRIIGKAMALNPALIFLSLSVWGSLLGFVGLIIAIPLTTLMIAYYNKYIIGDDEPEPGKTPPSPARTS